MWASAILSDSDDSEEEVCGESWKSHGFEIGLEVSLEGRGAWGGVKEMLLKRSSCEFKNLPI